MLYGRGEEVAKIRALLDGAAAGHGGALVIVGEPGAGKTALLDAAVDIADASWQVLRCAAIRDEAELPLVGLELLLSSTTNGIAALPKRETLRAAFDLSSPSLTDDRLLLGAGTLSLLTELSATGPVLCLIDDAQWLDQISADALSFAARRLGARQIMILLAGRTEFSTPVPDQLRLAPLDSAAARALLAERMPELSPQTRDRALAIAAGNPLALMELPRIMDDALPVGLLALPDRLQRGYQGRIGEQPDSVRLALLVAAADDSGDLALVLRVIADLGVTAEALDGAERSGIVTISGQTIVFRHPLERAAAYRIASFTQRLAVHAAIAAASRTDSYGRAWHLAAASTGPDETAAAALETAATRANNRASRTTAVMALEQAARLSPEPTDRGRRLLLATEAAADIGQWKRALELAAKTEGATPTGPEERARLASVQARIEFERGALPVAHGLFLDAAAHAAVAQPDRAAAMLLDAAVTAWIAADPSGVDVARTRLTELSTSPQHTTLRAAVDYVFAMPYGNHLGRRQSTRTSGRRDGSRFSDAPSVRLALAIQAIGAGDVDRARDILIEVGLRCRDRGMVGWLPAIYSTFGTVEMLLGHLPKAQLMLTTGLRIAHEIDQPNRASHAESRLAVLAAIHGDDARCRRFAQSSLRRSSIDSNAVNIAHAQWALGLLDLGHGRYDEATDRFEALDRSSNRVLGRWTHMMSDAVEAAVRLRDPQRATEPMAALERWFAATRAPWIEAHLLRCRGLLDGDGKCFARALALHAAAHRPLDQARTGLLYGEWLRRERCKTEARAMLRDALRTFEWLDARPWAERARAELRAAGATVAPAARSSAATQLTPQEFEVVRLAAKGATNKEIAARMLLSPKTVAHHLYRAFPKLGVTNRHALTQLDLDHDATAGP
ncbi:AAA family ATPase [Nocardia sp. NPDC049707]|uniref:helix-turn-helix transcriptional regulator n=1 Tax=Nocardia sp. NPDC049707 TaxID=3154735 RepID=UPI00341A7656